MDLYTSLVRLKMQLNDGRLPPMTPVPVSVQHVIDPSFTPGLGALEEDAERGLRCPVRDCGQYFHSLTLHLNRGHRRFGGAKKIRELLDIPPSVALCSQALSAKKRALTAQRTDDWRKPNIDKARKATIGQRFKHRAHRTMAARNLRNLCETQIRHALIDLQNRLGRSPSNRELIALLPNGSAILTEIIASYGTFDNCKAQLGMETYRKGATVALRNGKREQAKEMVLDAMQAWYNEHGSLPTSTVTERPWRTPALPHSATIMNAMETDNYPEAMRRIAARLNIYGGRYGLPEAHRPEVAA